MRKVRAATLLLLLAPAAAGAARVEVSDAAGLEAAIAAAAAGDELVLAPGIYELGRSLSCTAAGTPQAPIRVRAEPELSALIRFDALEGFKVSGPSWWFEGLDVHGVCATDDACEHAFHVTGGATDFRLLRSRVVDFNAQLKVNAAPAAGGGWDIPHRGVIDGCELFDTDPRDTSSPVTKLNIDTGDGWIVRRTFLHDFQKRGGNEVSYGAFMKSGGSGGLFERNLVVCSGELAAGGTRIGLSFGGGGTAPQYCAPAFDAAVPCNPEHSGGTMRNNVIAGCSDVGIYLNQAAGTALLQNTLIGTSGIDFRFGGTSGEAAGNLLDGRIRERDGGTVAQADNRIATLADFQRWYVAPLAGELTLLGDVAELVGAAPARAEVPDDFCGRTRPAGRITVGALEHSLGDCEPGGGGGGAGGAGGSGGAGAGGEGGSGGAGAGGTGAGGTGAGGTGAGGTGAGGTGAGGTGVGGTGAGGTGVSGSGGAAPDGDPGEAESGCGCTSGAAAPGLALLGASLLLGRRRRQIR